MSLKNTSRTNQTFFGRVLQRVPTRSYALLLCLFVLIGSVLFIAISSFTQRSAIQRLDSRAVETLNVYAANLGSEVSRYEAMPGILARTELFGKLLESEDNPDLLKLVNHELEMANQILGTLDVYLLNAAGLTIAASNWNKENTFIGEDLSFRPYYSDAMETGSARYFALGTNSKKRGYYFSSRISTQSGIGDVDTDKAKGVIVVKADLGAMEAAWAAGSEMVTATDSDGVFFISSNPDLLYRSMRPIPAEKLDEIDENRRFPGIVPQALDVKILSEEKLANGANTLSVSLSGPTHEDFKDYRVASSLLQNNWTVQIWSDLSGIQTAVARARTITLLCLIALALLATLILSKLQDRRRQRQLTQDSHNRLQEAYGQLERRVGERTEALSLSNSRLQAEIVERKQAEHDLHLAQDNLVHAGKMAAIGQMAASITHELSQPLGAVRTFADNASTFLERKQFSEVGNNLELIARMADRMKDMMRHLKSFSRKTPLALEPVNLQSVIDETRLVLTRQLAGIDLSVSFDKSVESVMVRAEAVRLQQVITNLLVNAIDALHAQSDKRIQVLVEQDREQPGFVLLSVKDSGPGIDSDILGSIFEPFHSSKSGGASTSDGLGLGLAISHAIMRDFKGAISVDENPGGGACMMLSLQEADPLVEKSTQGFLPPPTRLELADNAQQRSLENAR